MERCFEEGLDAVLCWSRRQDYSGYSKMDVLNSPLARFLSARSPLLRLLMTGAWSRSPVNLRPLLRVGKSRNPKGIALFALAYLNRYRRRRDEADLAAARALLDWLDRHPSPGFDNKCWGYNHPWQSRHFYAPSHSPNIVVTGNVAYAFLEAHETTGEERYLETARSVADFLLHDLEAPVDTPEARSISYVPGHRTGVLNVNGLAATLLSWLASLTGERRLAGHARRLMAFLVDKQTHYGAWYYAWPAAGSHVKHDNYHTGNVLDWILEYSRRSGDRSFLPSFEKGMDYYREHLFAADGRPKWMSHREYPADTHGAAQSIVSFSKASLWHDRRYLQDARRTARWTLDHLQRRKGYFVYQKGRLWTKGYTLMRWCNAWMAFALALLLRAEDSAAGEPAAVETP